MAREAAGRFLTARSGVLLAVAAVGVYSFTHLGLAATDLLPGDGLLPRARDLRTLGEFVSRAITPALDYESVYGRENAPPLIWKALEGAHRTVMLAVMAMSLAVIGAVPLGFLASRSLWRGDPARIRSPLVRVIVTTLFIGTRGLIAVLRSVHELLWAILLLAAMGTTNLAAVIAIAIPYAGTLAKVFSEMLDEADPAAALALQGTGATRSQAFVFGLLPRAAPDLASYAFYRLECAVRSAAVLGFFGPETLGKFISASWSENHYGEVWTYLYTLCAIVLLLEWWSGRLRRRFVA